MVQYNLNEFLPYLRRHGRTRLDKKAGALFFNWSDSGFTVRFSGTTLRAKVHSIGARDFMDPNKIEYANIGVVAQDGQSLVSRVECRAEEEWYTIWQAEQPGEYTVRVVKLSENARGKTGLVALETDGALLETLPEEKKLRVEIIGDSITCGYGIESANADAPFLTREENGWIAYGCLAARELNVELSQVCVSGIAVSGGLHNRVFPGYHPMEEAYQYTDQYYDSMAENEPERWDFAAHPSEVVLINLGTNDSNPMRFSPGLENALAEEEYFLGRYRAFIEQVRRLNGPDTMIFCTLGTMDYYLYNDIEKVVRAYQKETGDQNIECFKYVAVNLMTEGFGSAMHPSAMTHRRMGRELVWHLQKWMKEREN